MLTFDYVIQLWPQFSVSAVATAIVLALWAFVKFLTKEWSKEKIRSYFEMQNESFKQKLDSEYQEKQENFRQALDNEYKTKQESFKQALDNEYKRQQLQLNGVIAAAVERIRAEHAKDLARTNDELEKGRQVNMAATASRLEELKDSLDLKSKTRFANAEKRLDAYRSLWSKMESLSPQLDTPLDRPALETAFREWYYANGNGLLLTWQAADMYVIATRQLTQEVTDEDVRNTFSLLRTQMKVDVAVYSPEERNKQAGSGVG